MQSENDCILDEIVNRDIKIENEKNEKKETIDIKDLLIDFPNYSKITFEEDKNKSFIYKEPDIPFNDNNLSKISKLNDSNSIRIKDKTNTEKSLIKAIAIINNKSSLIGNSNPLESSPKTQIIDYFAQIDEYNTYILLFKKKLFTKLNNFFQIKLSSNQDKYEEFSNNIMKYFNIGFIFCFEGMIIIHKTYISINIK